MKDANEPWRLNCPWMGLSWLNNLSVNASWRNARGDRFAYATIAITSGICCRITFLINGLLVDRFTCKNNGVLYENDLIQIGVKSEFRQNLGRIALYFGNKTSFALQVTRQIMKRQSISHCSFSVTFVNDGLQGFSSSVGAAADLATKIVIQVKPVDATVEAGAQIQQLVNVECIEEFAGGSCRRNFSTISR